MALAEKEVSIAELVHLVCECECVCVCMCVCIYMYIERHFRIWQVAFAAIDEVAKLQYVLSIKEIPTVEGRNAELSVLSLLALLVQKYKY